MDSSKHEVIIDAARYGDTAAVTESIKKGVPIDTVDKYGRSALMLASLTGRTESVKCLIEAKASLDLQDKDGRSALMWASRNGRTESVKCLIEAKASLDLQDKSGFSALMLVSLVGHTESVKCLIEARASLDLQNQDGRSALMLASRYDRTESVRCLIEAKASLYLQDEDGHTALHRACQKYEPSKHITIDFCVILIEAGSNIQRKNTKGETPIDCLGSNPRDRIPRAPIQIDSQEAEPIRKAIERQEYHLHLSKDSLPVKVVKVFLVGDVMAGKTTIKKALTMQSKEESHLYIPTPGIDVGNYDIPGVGRVSLWDAAGHLEYHVSHGMFLGSRNTVAVVTYNLAKDDPVKRLRYWLRFLNSGQRRTSDSRMKILIVATHLDSFPDSSKANSLAERNLSDVMAYFGEDLNIAEDLIVVNGCLSQSPEMDHLRLTLKRAVGVIKGTRRVPRLCEEILETKSSWTSAKCPILLYESYKERVKVIDPLATDKLIQVSSNYLQDMGEVFLAYDGTQPTHVVLDTQWLAYHVIGPTLAGNEFTDVLKKVLPNKSSYTKHELEIFYSDVADFPTLSTLLQNLDLMVTFDDVNFIIPCKVRDHSQMTTASKNGRSVFCVDGKSMLSPSVFPAVQARVLKSIGSRFENPSMTKESIQVQHQVVGLAKESKEGRDAINFTVVYKENDPESCFHDLEKITSIIVTTLYELSPGTSVAIGYISPQSIQQCQDLQSVHVYSMEEIEAGESRYGTVYNISLKISEKTTDILVAGGDPYFIRQKGMECDYRWMLHKSKRQLHEHLDTTSCLRKDYRSLTDFLGIDGSILSDIENHRSSESCTSAVIQYWIETRRNRMTVGLLYSMLTHPGLVANMEAASVIDTMFKDLRIDVSLSNKDYRSVGTRLPDAVLVWRAIIRRTHEELQKHINPTTVARSILSEDDANGVEEIDRTEGRMQAVDHVISKLLELKDLEWTNTFPHSLKQQHPGVSIDVMKAKKDLLKEYGFLQSKYYVSSTITPSDGGILELPEFGVRLEIPPGVVAEKVDISVYIVTPKDDYPPLGDNFIIAPMIRLEPDCLQFLRPFTLTVTHSATDLKLRNMQVWNKSGDMDWQVIFDGKDGSDDSNILLKGNNVKIRRKRFCVWCWIGRSMLDVQIMPFINRDLLTPQTVSLTVFVLRNDLALSVANERAESNNQILACDKPTIHFCAKMCENLKIKVEAVREVKRNKHVWQLGSGYDDQAVNVTIQDHDMQVITYKDLQCSSRDLFCRFHFTKREGDETTDSIWGFLEISQDNNEEFRQVEVRYIMPEGSVRQTAEATNSRRDPVENAQGLEQLSDEDIRLITRNPNLVKAELDDLFGVLNISPADQEIGRGRAGAPNFQLQAKEILHIWRQRNGKAATRNAVIAALLECELIDLKETMETRWSLATM